MNLLTNAKKLFGDLKRKILFSLDFKDDISVYYYSFFLTYTFIIVTCLVMCKRIPIVTDSTGVPALDEYWLRVIQTILDTVIPSTITFACGVFIQNLAIISRKGATNYVWNLVLLFASFMYWGDYLYSIERVTTNKGYMLILFAIFIVVLCTTSTIKTYKTQNVSTRQDSDTSISA